MVTVCVRKQGGAAVITIPSAILRLLNLEIGAMLELDVKKGTLIARPDTGSKPKRYTLAELLEGATPESIKALNKKTSWARQGNIQGAELA